MRHAFPLLVVALSALTFGGVWYVSGANTQAAGPVAPATLAASVHYDGCDAVRAVGAAPLYAGQPGYRSDMDGDGDGIACEPHRDHETFGRMHRRR